MTAPGGFSAGDVLGAADMNGLPAGKMGYASVTANQTSISTTTDLTSLTVTWTAVSSRLYQISFQVAVDPVWTTGSAQPTIYITDGSNNVKQTVTSDVLADLSVLSMTGFVLETSLSGSTTRKLRAAFPSSSGSDTMTMTASSTRPAFILVEDIGPA